LLIGAISIVISGNRNITMKHHYICSWFTYVGSKYCENKVSWKKIRKPLDLLKIIHYERNKKSQPESKGRKNWVIEVGVEIVKEIGKNFA